MSDPIPTFKDSTIAGTRRTEGGQFWLQPTPEVRQIVLYLALHYAARHGMRLYALNILSNHIHWVGEDRHGAYPDFLRDFHSMVTEVLNDHHGRRGRMWEACDPCRTRIEDHQTLLNNLLYTITNAVKHGLTPVSTLWPGLILSPERAGKSITVEAPPYLLEKYDSFPPVIEYTIPAPKPYQNMPLAKVRRRFRDRRRAKERRLRRKRRNKPFLGVEKAMERPPSDAPAEPPAPAPNNLVAAATPEATTLALQRIYTFRRAYRRARKAFLAGNRAVIWPPGTYAMVAWHGCPGP